jgi:hypothetical protein
MADAAHDLLLTCGLCGKVWHCLDDVVADAGLELTGYQARFDDPADGLVLVTHRIFGCGTTLAFPVSVLRPLYCGPEYTERMALTDECSRQCLDHNLLEVCEAPCDMAWVRRVMQSIRRHCWLPAGGTGDGDG